MAAEINVDERTRGAADGRGSQAGQIRATFFRRPDLRVRSICKASVGKRGELIDREVERRVNREGHRRWRGRADIWIHSKSLHRKTESSAGSESLDGQELRGMLRCHRLFFARC